MLMEIGSLVHHVRDPQRRLGMVYAWGISDDNQNFAWVRVLWSDTMAPWTRTDRPQWTEGATRRYHLVRELKVVQ
jgi:hypothetical protein